MWGVVCGGGGGEGAGGRGEGRGLVGLPYWVPNLKYLL
jgi:hypothetical protein